MPPRMHRAGSMGGWMDAELGRRYLALAVRLDRRAPGLLEAYAGPAELPEAIAGETQPPFAELHDEALSLHEEAATTPVISSADEQRRTWLTSQAGALGTVARVLRGDEIALPERVESLTGLDAARAAEPDLAAIHRQLDAALPPGPGLRARMSQHRAATSIPPEQVPTAVERLLASMRDRARNDLALPPYESVLVEPVHDASTWHARAAFEAPSRTRLRINLSVPWSLDELVRAVAGEAYPGRHVAHVARTASVRDGRDDELLAWVRPSPEATVLAGVAGVGREVLLGDFELAAELRRIGRELGQRWDTEREVEVARARERLAAAVANAALLLHHDGLPESEVRAYLAETALLEADAVERLMARFADPLGRVEPVARAAGPPLVRDWLAVVGQTHGLRRLLTEGIAPAQLRMESGVPA
jgi:hypothetical protein